MQVYRDRVTDQRNNTTSYRKIGNSRLLKLAAFLRLVPPDKFDLTHWFSRGELCRDSEPSLKSCGTKGCALGWATAMPLFRRLGLVIDFTDRAIVALKREDLGYSCYSPMVVAQHLFAISMAEADLLFAPGVQECDATPVEVANFIERFVQARGEDLQHYGDEFVDSAKFREIVIDGQ
jgi:hypothetical protein